MRLDETCRCLTKVGVFLLAVVASASVYVPAVFADSEATKKAIEEVLVSKQCSFEDGTVQRCVSKLESALRDARMAFSTTLKADQLEKRDQAKVNSQDKATSAESGTSGASPLRDVLSRLIAGAGIPGLTDDNGELVFAYNAPKGLFDEGATLSLKATAKEGKVYQPLLTAFGEDVRAAKKTALEDRLGDFDDVEFELAVSRLSERWGRDFDFHKDLFDALWIGAANSRSRDAVAQVGLLKVLNTMCRDTPEFFDQTFKELADPNLCKNFDYIKLRAALADGVSAMVTAFANLVTIAKEKGVMDVADLVNNQPQVFFSLKYQDRDGELTGPDQLSAQFKWEKGFRNVNGLRSHCEGRTVADSKGRKQPSLDCVYEYLYCDRSDPTACSDRNRALKAPRISLSAEYVDVDSYAFSPETGIDLMRDGSESIKAMFGYGRQLSTDADGTGGTRLDFESMYEDVSNDPMKNSRWINTLTYSQQVANETAASISLVWANKPEFLGEVDEELSARLGLKWTMDSKKK